MLEKFKKRHALFKEVIRRMKEGNWRADVEFADFDFAEGNTTRAFRKRNSGIIGENRTIASKVISTLSSLGAQKELRKVLAEPCPEKRLDLKLKLASDELDWLRDNQGIDTNPFKRVKMIDLALKQFIFTFKPEERCFANTDAALDSRILNPLVGIEALLNYLPNNPAMGSVQNETQYLEIQKFGARNFEDGWTFDFVFWDLDRLKFVDGASKP